MPEVRKCHDSLNLLKWTNMHSRRKIKENFAIVKSATLAGNDHLCHNKGENLKSISVRNI
jgi:hypothetical protein